MKLLQLRYRPAHAALDHNRLNAHHKLCPVTHRLLFEGMKRDFKQMGFNTAHLAYFNDDFGYKFGFIFTGYILALG